MRKEMSHEDFRKMQLVQMDMLVEFDRVCRENNIKYSIFCGTLLGAVRHKGYIPWDDDADIAMLREEYEKFRKVADKLDSKICFFQDYKNDEYYRWGYSKLRRTNTEYIRIGQEHMKYKTGISIDIFPLDDAPKSTFMQILQDGYCCVLRKVLYSEVGRVNPDYNFLLRFWYKMLSKIPASFIHRRFEKMEAKSRNDSSNLVRCLSFPNVGKLYVKNSLKTRFAMPKKWFLDLDLYEFEGHKLYGTKDYDGILTYIYRDYMTLPPVEKRDPHSPVSYYSFDVAKDKVNKEKKK